ncbi:MAG: tetratricopeptide repeat protein [Methylococcaceae bacterium]
MTELHTQAISEMQQQANNGDAQAQFDLAYCFAHGRGIQKNTELAFNWNQKAAEQGLVNAQLAMGFYYFLDVDEKQTKRLIDRDMLEFALNNPPSPDPLELGVSLAWKTDIKQRADAELAFAWFKKAAEQGCAEAQYWLARCYYDGLGIEQSGELAFEWFKKSAEQGFSESQYSLALCYSNGTGVEQSNELAFEWITKAVGADKTELYFPFGGEAYLFLSDLYFCGKGVEKNNELYYKWFEKAAENGNVEAKKHFKELFFGAGIGYRTGQHDGEEFEIIPELAFELFCKAANYGSVHAHWCIGECYQNGIGVEKNDKLAFEHFKMVLELADADISNELSEDLRTAANLSISKCYREGKGVEKNEELANQHCDRVDNDSLGNAFYEGLMHHSPKAAFAKEALGLRLHLHNSLGEFDKATDHVNKVFENADGSDNTFKEISLELIKSKKELEEKNQQLQKAKDELEDMMSMFAHKFRSPLDAIIYNTTHENQVKLYTEAAQTMRGLLDIFSLISTDAALLKRKLMADNYGNGRLTTTFSKALDMVLLHLLTNSNREKVRQHYIVYAKLNGKVDSNISRKVWREDFFELEQSLQTDWEQGFATLILQSASLTDKLDWVSKYFFPIELIGFDREDIEFEEYGITESLLMMVINEIAVNVFKYYSCESKQPVIIEWVEKNGSQVISCRNPSYGSERTIFKGSQKGHVFLSTLARNIGSHFIKPIPQDEFVVEFGIPNELLISNK